MGLEGKDETLAALKTARESRGKLRQEARRGTPPRSSSGLGIAAAPDVSGGNQGGNQSAIGKTA